MAARRSLLERRLSILATAGPKNAWLVAGFVALCTSCLAAAALPVPRAPPAPVHSPAPKTPRTRSRGDILALGVVTAATVKVTARVDGRLASVDFAEGRPVKVGELLASIESPRLRAQRDRAQDKLARDRALGAKAAIPSDEAAVAQARQLLANTQVRAPISGVAGLRKVDPGNFVRTGDTLLVITQLHPIAVVFSIAEEDLPRVQPLLTSGAAPVVEIRNRANTIRLATGHLEAIDNEIDTATGTIKLKASVDNRAGTLLPNQFVNVRLLMGAR